MGSHWEENVYKASFWGKNDLKKKVENTEGHRWPWKLPLLHLVTWDHHVGMTWSHHVRMTWGLSSFCSFLIFLTVESKAQAKASDKSVLPHPTLTFPFSTPPWACPCWIDPHTARATGCEGMTIPPFLKQLRGTPSENTP